ncbi:EI24 domain-containing protein [Demequina activiva]|uniref:Membrane protein n=1 Tax=Demequina activiva TaxID=1582364 RepID=A0A919Q1P0_9MICO|nr:EI24 domain-containing protein [Demequina activiva]GIG54562.1 membrane protein [Demequina activiva]
MSEQGRGRGGALREALLGASLAWQGMRTWGTSPRLMLIGLIPGVVSAVLLGSGALVLVSQIARIGDAIAVATVGEDGWLHDAVQVVGMLAVLGAAAVIGVYTFTALTLLIGQPFFERLAREVDRGAGWEGEDPDETVWRGVIRGVGEALRLAILTVPLAVGLFLVGLVPAIGGPAAVVLGASFGGWFLALELTGYPLARRGLVPLQERRALLRQHRARVVGFGAAVFLLFLVPFGALAFMPAAVAGATRLVQGLDVDAALSGRPPRAPRP